MKPTLQRWLKPLLLSGVFLATATALIGWMHTPSGLRALYAMGVPCPMDKVTAAQVVAGHAQGLVAVRGTSPAPQRPALGLLLDQTTEANALAWAQEKKMQCDTVVRGLRYLRCRGVPADALGIGGPPISEMWLSFAPTSKLIGLNVYRRGLSPSDLDTAWLSSVGRLQAQLGTPSVQAGDASASALMRSDYATARVQYRFSNYIATVTAANLSYAGLSLREQYVSANS
jgi:hypothetical protein